MTDLTIPDEAQEAALQAVMDVRDASPRVPDDADSYAVAMAALRVAAPAIVAAELRRLCGEFNATRQEWRQVDDRPLRSSGLGHAVDVLRDRAEELECAK